MNECEIYQSRELIRDGAAVKICHLKTFLMMIFARRTAIYDIIC